MNSDGDDGSRMHTEKTRTVPDWLIGLGLALVLVPVVLAVLGALGAGDDPSFVTGTRAGETEPSRVTFLSFAGTESSLAEYRGSPLVIHFWASWCPACVADLPRVAELERRLAGSVRFLGVNSLEVSPEAARRLVVEEGVTYPLAEDPDGDVFAQLGGAAMPAIMLLDSSGEVVDAHTGALDIDDLERRIRQSFGL